MPRWRIEVLSCLLAGCALEEGRPFGVAELSLGAHFDLPGDRTLPDGRAKTANDYALRFYRLAIAIEEIRLDVRSPGEAVGFDPADPPPGYSLCHNGHCHADDGRLVDYEDIVLEIGGAAPGAAVVVPVAQPEVSLASDPAPVALVQCPNDCVLPRGQLGAVALHVPWIAFEVEAEDLRRGDQARLTTTLTLNATVAIDAQLDRALDVAIESGEPLYLRLDLHAAIPVALFDAADWADAAAEPSRLQPVLAARLAELEALTLEMTRHD